MPTKNCGGFPQARPLRFQTTNLGGSWYMPQFLSRCLRLSLKVVRSFFSAVTFHQVGSNPKTSKALGWNLRKWHKVGRLVPHGQLDFTEVYWEVSSADVETIHKRPWDVQTPSFKQREKRLTSPQPVRGIHLYEYIYVYMCVCSEYINLYIHSDIIPLSSIPTHSNHSLQSFRQAH